METFATIQHKRISYLLLTLPVERARVHILVQIEGMVRAAAPQRTIPAAPTPAALEPRVPHAHALRHGFSSKRGVWRPGIRLVPSPVNIGRYPNRSGGVGGDDTTATQVRIFQREERVPEGRAERLADERSVRVSVCLLYTSPSPRD